MLASRFGCLWGCIFYADPARPLLQLLLDCQLASMEEEQQQQQQEQEEKEEGEQPPEPLGGWLFDAFNLFVPFIDLTRNEKLLGHFQMFRWLIA